MERVFWVPPQRLYSLEFYSGLLGVLKKDEMGLVNDKVVDSS